MVTKTHKFEYSDNEVCNIQISNVNKNSLNLEEHSMMICLTHKKQAISSKYAISGNWNSYFDVMRRFFKSHI